MKAKIKICGITNIKDALLAADLGAYAVGFVFYKESKRYVSYDEVRKIAQKLPPFVVRVGVFVNEKPENVLAAKEYCFLDRVQLHSDREDHGKRIIPGITIMAYRVKDEKDIEAARQSLAFPLLDSHVESMYGGSGSCFNWHLLKDFGRPYILAGGINSENINEALGFKPYAIDIASGVEMRPGVKDPRKMRDIFDKVQG
ncbi:MAG: N-(5'-phosphoribosyl)anthranilate isomerase [Syntrophorhabdus sp. PtaU1.Bin050]|nr:MAG: N-(5'-phosphoribosyl)anthranilate isomerase [Syntrophorhabdus sp. PtaU1.Bin050]